jgi:hypothetical protein
VNFQIPGKLFAQLIKNTNQCMRKAGITQGWQWIENPSINAIALEEPIGTTS